MLTNQSPVTLPLRPEYFTAATPTPFAHWDDLTASTFRYPSGACGLRLANARGWVDLLPFQGQQIWDAHFLGRSLAMESIYAGPVPAGDYRRSYGAFGVHCGATAMGNPGPLDQHPLHGELPNAGYQSAAVQFGTDGSGRRQLALTGIYHHSVAHTHSYLATPTVRLGEGATVVDVDMEIKNLRSRPMDLMYLCHLNFRPVDGGRLVDTVPPGGLRLRSRVLAGEPEPGLRTDSLPKLVADPEIHRNLLPELTFDPEAVLFLDYRTDPDGWAHSMQLHPDGTADYVKHRPDELDHAVRWLSRNPEQQALGLCLPATAEPDGYLAERDKGNIRTIGPGESFCCRITVGALDAEAASVMSAAISRTMGAPR